MNQIKTSINQLLILVMALVFATVRTCRFWRNTPEEKEPINPLIQFVLKLVNRVQSAGLPK